MKVVAFNGSPRKDGNTSILIRHVFEELSIAGIETEFVQVGGRKISGCRGCNKCWEKKDGHCIFNDDILNGCLDKMVEADGIILGSPTYFSDVTTETKALIDRAGYVCKANGGLFQGKVGAAVSAVRRAGSIHALDTMSHFFLGLGMVMPGASYWALGMGRNPGEVENDEEGIRTMHDLGRNMARVLKALRG